MNVMSSDFSNGDLRWLERASRVAQACHMEGAYRLAAIAVRGGSVLAVGVNKHRNNPLWLPELPRSEWSTHAEESCLKQISKPANCTLYVARVTPGGNFAMARPCSECQMLAMEYGVSKVIYTTSDGAGMLRLREMRAEAEHAAIPA